ILEKKRMEQRGQIARPIPYTYVPPYYAQPQYAPQQQPYDQYRRVPPPLPGEKPEKARPKEMYKVKPPEARKGFFLQVTPKLEFNSKAIVENRHSRGETTYQATGPKWELKVDPHYAFSPDRNGDQIDISLPFTYAASQQSGDSKKLDFELQAEDFVTKEELSDQELKFYKLGVAPKVSFPVGAVATLSPWAKY